MKTVVVRWDCVVGRPEREFVIKVLREVRRAVEERVRFGEGDEGVV